MKKSTIIFLGGIVLFILIVVWSFSKSGSGIDPSILSCLTENTKVYVSSTCSVCGEQKKMFGVDFKKFNSVDCSSQGNVCEFNNILRVPTWEINGVKYEGLKSVDELRDLTNC